MYASTCMETNTCTRMPMKTTVMEYIIYAMRFTSFHSSQATIKIRKNMLIYVE